jgi:DNA polymerase III subunit epsilon
MSPRLRLWLLFGGLALASAAVLGGAAWLAASGRAPAPLCWAGATVLLIAVQAGLWSLLDRTWLRPSLALAREIELLIHANARDRFAPLEAPGLGPLPAAIAALAERWRTGEARGRAALEEATARLREQQSRLEALLRDLSDGVIACTANRRILLFNHAALEILDGHPELGLDRPLDRLIAREPIVHAYDSLCEAQTGFRARPGGGPGRGGREEFVCATADGAKLLRCRMALILAADGAPGGFVLDFADATSHLGRVEQRELRLIQRIEALRAPVAAVRAAAEVLGGESPPAADERRAFLEVIGRESRALSERVESLCQASEGLVADAWPMADLFSGDLVRWTNRRLAGRESGPALTPVGAGLWLHGDGYHLTLLLAGLARRIGAATSAPALDLEVHERRRRIELDLVWAGAPLAVATLEAWLDQALEPEAAGLRLRDVLGRHDGELWSQAHDRTGHALVRLLLPGPKRPQPGALPTAERRPPPRPEFYDFDLLARAREQPASLLDQPLGALSYVVLDTETTGLDPRGDDQIVQLAGVRIVNRRLLTGELFDVLVNPGRPIPKASSRFHGITDDMVRGRPPIEIVLPQFHAFARDSVLVAHNAAFDLAFLRRDEHRCALRFDHPVLDTLLLSATVHDHITDHSLDAIAARFGIPLEGRHRASADAIATAQLFLRLLDLLEARGVTTLGAALALCGRAVALRRRQAEAFGGPQAAEVALSEGAP